MFLDLKFYENCLRSNFGFSHMNTVFQRLRQSVLKWRIRPRKGLLSRHLLVISTRRVTKKQTLSQTIGSVNSSLELFPRLTNWKAKCQKRCSGTKSNMKELREICLKKVLCCILPFSVFAPTAKNTMLVLFSIRICHSSCFEGLGKHYFLFLLFCTVVFIHSRTRPSQRNF